jgi:hypothetical protein
VPDFNASLHRLSKLKVDPNELVRDADVLVENVGHLIFGMKDDLADFILYNESAIEAYNDILDIEVSTPFALRALEADFGRLRLGICWVTQSYSKRVHVPNRVLEARLEDPLLRSYCQAI